MQSFVEVGAALIEIRDAKLYRDGFDTFDDYCSERWDFSRQRAYQLIDASALVGLFSTTVDTVPTSERVIPGAGASPRGPRGPQRGVAGGPRRSERQADSA
jgi:hypothetical protein